VRESEVIQFLTNAIRALAVKIAGRIFTRNPYEVLAKSQDGFVVGSESFSQSELQFHLLLIGVYQRSFAV
jgi:hypothetical protein